MPTMFCCWPDLSKSSQPCSANSRPRARLSASGSRGMVRASEPSPGGAVVVGRRLPPSFTWPPLRGMNSRRWKASCAPECLASVCAFRHCAARFVSRLNVCGCGGLGSRGPVSASGKSAGRAEPNIQPFASLSWIRRWPKFAPSGRSAAAESARRDL